MRFLVSGMVLVAIVSGCTKSSPTPAKPAPQSTPTAATPPAAEKPAPQTAPTATAPPAAEKPAPQSTPATPTPPAAEKPAPQSTPATTPAADKPAPPASPSATAPPAAEKPAPPAAPSATTPPANEKPASPAAPPATTPPATNKPAPPPKPTTSTPPAAEKPAGKFAVGDPAPEFKGLVGIDDKPHSLSEYADAKAVAVVFTCNHCPVAVEYEDRLVALEKDYAGKGVRLVAINVQNLEEDKLPAMKQRATAKGFNFAYLYDPSQEIGRKFGAAVTPHVFLLDGKRRLAYVGPVDDSQDQGKVAHQYLRDAIEAVLAGKAPSTADVKPFGCGIQYE